MSCLTWVVSPATGFDLQPQTRTRSTKHSVRRAAPNVSGARFALLAWQIELWPEWETRPTRGSPRARRVARRGLEERRRVVDLSSTRLGPGLPGSQILLLGRRQAVDGHTHGVELEARDLGVDGAGH